MEDSYDCRSALNIISVSSSKNSYCQLALAPIVPEILPEVFHVFVDVNEFQRGLQGVVVRMRLAR